MQKQILVLAIMAHGALTSYAHADEWVGQDKTLHFLGGAAVGAAVTIATQRRDYGIAAGVGVGLVKELYDAQNRDKHTPSIKDFAVTVAGAALGAYAGGWIITPRFIGYQTSF
jgi:uncharacterized protein YfiM (DUF2279 family)